jgi:hypothetical protein
MKGQRILFIKLEAGFGVIFINVIDYSDVETNRKGVREWVSGTSHLYAGLR